MIPHPDSVSPHLLALIRRLAAEPDLEPFSLGGGTSLALRFGHRESIDIDLFTDRKFDPSRCQDAVRALFPDVEVVNRTPGSLCVLVQQIKVDILYHPYTVLHAPEKKAGIRFVSLPDIAAMKINAVTNRGSKKDFSDLLLLHEQGFSLERSLDYFCAKYGDAGWFLAIRSLAYFGDADEEPEPRYLNGWTWEHVRETMAALSETLVK